MLVHAASMDLEALAAAQDGVVTTSQLRECRVTRALERRRLETGEWVRLHRGVILVAPERATTNGVWVSARGAALACPGGVLAGRTAARLYGIDGAPPGPDEVCVPCDKGRRVRPGLVAHRYDLAAGEVRTLRGMRVTTPSRTVLDLALSSDRLVALAVMDSAMRKGLVGRDDLVRLGRSSAGMRGSAVVRDLWAAADRRAESVLESRVRLRCLDAGLPPDELQLVVDDGNGAVVGRADLAFRLPGGTWLLVEADGAGVHGSADALHRDRTRANALTALGHLLLRFTWRDTLDPFVIPRAIRAVLRSARQPQRR